MLLGRPPRWTFHALVTAAAAVLLYAFSPPGFGYFALMGSLAALSIAALVWVLRLVIFLRRRRAWSWWFAVAPVGGLLVWALLVTDAPFRARWAVSRTAFESSAVAIGQLPAGSVSIDVPERLGVYRVIGAYRVPDGVIFQEANGAFTDDAGFAYLPGGPTPAVEGRFEEPTFEHLGGPWYAWTSGW